MSLYSIFFCELKNRFFLLLLTGLSVIVVSYWYKEAMLFAICSNTPFSFIYTSVTEVFSIYLTLIFFITNQVLATYCFFHFLVFLAPGLYDNEYYLIKMLFYANLCLFVLLMLIFNLVLFPLSCDFFLSFQHVIFKPLNFYFEAKINDYFRFYIILYDVCYLYFQIFFFLNFFFYILDQKLQDIKLFRKLFYFLFCTFCITAVPMDILGQVTFFFSLAFFYELLILKFVFRRSLFRINLKR